VTKYPESDVTDGITSNGNLRQLMKQTVRDIVCVLLFVFLTGIPEAIENGLPMLAGLTAGAVIIAIGAVLLSRAGAFKK
jgi:hypothetical protein